MGIQKDQRGKFISRPNRFIARVQVDGKEEICHVRIQEDAESFWCREPESFWRRQRIPIARPVLIWYRCIREICW